MEEKIIHNRIKCLICGDIVESKTVHDYVSCKCGNCAADGGKEYLRRTGSDWEELSEIETTR